VEGLPTHDLFNHQGTEFKTWPSVPFSHFCFIQNCLVTCRSIIETLSYDVIHSHIVFPPLNIYSIYISQYMVLTGGCTDREQFILFVNSVCIAFICSLCCCLCSLQMPLLSLYVCCLCSLQMQFVLLCVASRFILCCCFYMYAVHVAPRCSYVAYICMQFM